VAGRSAILHGTRDDGSKLPVVTARTHLWSQPDNEEWGGPQHVAEQLNDWAKGGAQNIAERVAYIPVNAWSTFELDGRKFGAFEGTLETAKRLNPNIKLVTIPQLSKLLKNMV